MNYLTQKDLMSSIAKNQIDEVFLILGDNQKSFPNKELFKTFTAIHAGYSRIQEERLKGIISEDDFAINHHRNVNRLIEIVDRLGDSKFILDQPKEDLDLDISLKHKIDDHDLWETLLKIARDAVIAGGITGMGFYKEAWEISENIGEILDNPTTNADVEATVAILRSIDSRLPKVCNDLNCDLQYFGEEISSKTISIVLDRVSPILSSKIKDEDTFFSEKKNRLGVIFDAIDGTGNFKKGFPIFCSAIAILIDSIPRISAIYDPVHHVVYTAILPGPDKNLTRNAEAHLWHVSIGQVKKMPPVDANKKLTDENIGIHFTRSQKNKVQLKEMVNSVEKLVNASSGVYAINSGIFSMTEIARGALGGFVNNRTNPWDITPGEVLIKAVGGKVTDFNGHELVYTSNTSISVIAAATENLHKEILDTLA